MIRLAAAILIASALPALSTTSQTSMQVGFVIMGTASSSPAVRRAAAAIMPAQSPSRTFVTCEGDTCVKTIYY
jgi:hypothetical protein